MATLCLRIPNQDRIGLVFDISRILAEQNINIISMEVAPNDMYLEIGPPPLADRLVWLQEQLLSISQIQDVRVTSHMPHQEREQKLKTVLDSIVEGIVAINREEIITHFNPAAEQVLGYKENEVLGKKIGEIIGPGAPLLDALHNGVSFNNREVAITTPRGKSHYLSSGRPIRDANGTIIGGVAVLKTMHDVQELVNSVTKAHSNNFSDILHVSRAMQRAIELAKLVAQNDSTVLIRGESGTGKELFARAIHQESPRRDNIFAPINCAALPDALLESELFGYEDGAFTGAKKGGKSGLFEFADGGTVLLDEIGELSANLQAKLLRILQEGKVRRIGSNHEIAVNVRIIAATHRNLEEMIRKTQFRDDLYYRLNVIPIHIPPLRERRDDLPLLVNSLLLKINHRLKKQIDHISEPAMRALMQYEWPGNVRELENVIERAVSLACQGEITLDHIMLDSHPLSSRPLSAPPPTGTLKDLLAELECQILQEAMQKYGSSRQAGKNLGLSHTAVLKRLKKYHLREAE
jgi:transcriptional regulator of aroF, aroG, tyrA and aromatic amino acid transport